MNTPIYMLDTNIVSLLIRGNDKVQRKLQTVPITQIVISSITEAELRRGVAKKPGAKKLPLLVNEFLVRVDILSWGSEEAVAYAKLRTESEKIGVSLGTMDMLIASHAFASKSTLITNDKAFFKFKDFVDVEDWA